MLEQRGTVLLLRLGRHLLDRATLEELAAALDRAAAARCPLVVAGGERIFLAGAHLGEIASLDPARAGTYADRGRGVLARLERFPAPTAAAVRGACAGGGTDLALACDLVVVHPRAVLGHPGVRRGLVTGWGGTARLAAATLAGRARLLLAGELLRAEEAVAAGLADLVDPEPERAAAAAVAAAARLGPTRLAAWRASKSGRFIDRSAIPVVHRLLMTDSEPSEPWERA